MKQRFLITALFCQLILGGFFGAGAQTRPRTTTATRITKSQLDALTCSYATDAGKKWFVEGYGDYFCNPANSVTKDGVISGTTTNNVTNTVTTVTGENNAASYSSFGAAVTAVAAYTTSPNVLSITSPISISANQTIPSNVVLEIERGGVLNITGGTLVVQGEIRAGADKIFNLTGTGDVDLSQAKFEKCYFEWFGIVPETDNAASMQRMLDVGKSRNYTTTIIQLVEKGRYTYSTPININRSLGITINGAPAGTFKARSSITYTGSGAESAFVAHAVNNFSANNVTFDYNSSGFTGYLFDINRDALNNSGDNGGISFNNCTFAGGGNTSYHAKALLLLASTTVFSIKGCVFKFGMVGIRGRGVRAETIFVGESNLGQIDASSFSDLGTSIQNIGHSWSITNNNFEGIQDLPAAGGTATNIGIDRYGEPITYSDLRAIDATDTDEMWNLVVSGNQFNDFGGGASNYGVIRIRNAQGVLITGNTIYGGGGTGYVIPIVITDSYGVNVIANNVGTFRVLVGFIDGFSYGTTITGNRSSVVQMLAPATGLPASFGNTDPNLGIGKIMMGNGATSTLFANSIEGLNTALNGLEVGNMGDEIPSPANRPNDNSKIRSVSGNGAFYNKSLIFSTVSGGADFEFFKANELAFQIGFNGFNYSPLPMRFGTNTAPSALRQWNFINGAGALPGAGLTRLGDIFWNGGAGVTPTAPVGWIVTTARAAGIATAPTDFTPFGGTGGGTSTTTLPNVVLNVSAGTSIAAHSTITLPFNFPGALTGDVCAASTIAQNFPADVGITLCTVDANGHIFLRFSNPSDVAVALGTPTIKVVALR